MERKLTKTSKIRTQGFARRAFFWFPPGLGGSRGEPLPVSSSSPQDNEKAAASIRVSQQGLKRDTVWMKWRDNKKGRNALNIFYMNKIKKKQTFTKKMSAPSVLVFCSLFPDGCELCVIRADTPQIMQAIWLQLSLHAPNLHPVSRCQWLRG